MNKLSDAPVARRSATKASKVPNIFKIGCGGAAGVCIDVPTADGRRTKAIVHSCAEHIDAVVAAAPKATVELHTYRTRPPRCGDGATYTRGEEHVHTVAGATPDWREHLGALIACHRALMAPDEAAEVDRIREELRAYMAKSPA